MDTSAPTHLVCTKDSGTGTNDFTFICYSQISTTFQLDQLMLESFQFFIVCPQPLKEKGINISLSL